MDTLTILKRARALIADSNHWTQGALGRNPKGESIGYMSPDTVKRCMIGAVAYVAGGLNRGVDEVIEELEKGTPRLVDSVPVRRVSRFNDTATHDRVIKHIDRTIARLEGTKEVDTESRLQIHQEPTDSTLSTGTPSNES